MTPITAIRFIDIAIGLTITLTCNTTRPAPSRPVRLAPRWGNRILHAGRRTPEKFLCRTHARLG